MEIILQMQRTSKALSEELFPRNKWIDLPNRRIKELKNSSSVTRKDKEDTRSFLWMGQNRRCAACDKQIGIGEATLEHELPKAMHGPNTITNLSVTCRRCNEEKGDSLPFGLTADDLRWSNYIPHNGLVLHLDWCASNGLEQSSSIERYAHALDSFVALAFHEAISGQKLTKLGSVVVILGNL